MKQKVFFYCIIACAVLVGCGDASTSEVHNDMQTIESVAAETTETFGADIVEEFVENGQTTGEVETVETITESVVEETVERRGNEIGMEGIDETAENLGKEYTVNEDGTYTCGDKVYKYKMALTGRGVMAVCDARYIVLTNYKGLSFEDVDRSFVNSSGNGIMLETVIIGLEVFEEE